MPLLKVRAARLNRGLTQQDVAIFLRMPVAELSRIENGRERAFPAYRERLAKFFQLGPDELQEEVER
jgi:transcriptional regulator with XRE-family HTH domain